jgi:hypothetical protein
MSFAVSESWNVPPGHEDVPSSATIVVGYGTNLALRQIYAKTVIDVASAQTANNLTEGRTKNAMFTPTALSRSGFIRQRQIKITDNFLVTVV